MEVFWNDIVENFNVQIINGANKIIIPTLVLLSLLTVIKIYFIMKKYQFGEEISKIISELINIVVTFSLYSFIIKNIIEISNTFFTVFVKIGEIFTNKNNLETTDEIWKELIKISSHILRVINDWNLYINSISGKIEIIADIAKFLQDCNKILMLLIALIFIYYIFIKIIVEMIIATIQFRLGIILTIPFLSTEVIDYLKDVTGGKFLTVLFISGLKISVNILLLAMYIEIVNKVNFTENMTIDTIELQKIYLFIAVSFVMSYLINKTNNIVNRLSN